MIKAINSKYQGIVNRVIAWDIKYNDEVNREDCEGYSAKRQENAYNKASELFDELPKREQENLIKNGIQGY